MAGPGLTINAANVFASAENVTLHDFRANETLTQGMLVYLRSDNRWGLVNTQLAAAGNLQNQVKGITVNKAFANQPVSVCISDPNFSYGDTVEKGRTYVADNLQPGQQKLMFTNSAVSRILGGVASSTTTVSLILKSTGANSG
jgi:hypothetical protein